MLLNSMKVVSFCHVLQGPSATQYLADMGASVIKVEPLGGERSRRWTGVEMGPPSGLYLCAFRNKRLFSVDLKSAEGRDVVLALIDKADVVIENFRHGVMERLGLSYEAIRQRKPDIIYASGTGWGSKGPMLARESQDLIIEARTGLASTTGYGRGNAKAVGSAIVDQHGGALLAMGVMAAYIRKLTTGQGTLVESSLFAAGFDLQTEPLTVYMSTRPGAEVLNRDRHLATWYHWAPYGIYKIKDCEIAVSTNPVSKLAEALNSDDLRALVNVHPYKDRDQIAAVFAKAIEQKSLAEVAAVFDPAGIWYGKVQNFDDVARDPQAEALEVFRTIKIGGKDLVLVNHPIRYDGKIPELRTIGLEVGEHTEEILREHGYTEEQIADLLKRRIVAAPERTAKTQP